MRDQAKLTNVRVLEPTALRSVECLKTPIEAMRFADLVRDLDRASVEIVWALTW